MTEYQDVKELGNIIEKQVGKKDEYKLLVTMSTREEFVDESAEPKIRECFVRNDSAFDVLDAVRVIVDRDFKNITKAFGGISEARVEQFKGEMTDSLKNSKSVKCETKRKFPKFWKKSVKFNVFTPLNGGREITGRKIGVLLEVFVE